MHRELFYIVTLCLTLFELKRNKKWDGKSKRGCNFVLMYRSSNNNNINSNDINKAQLTGNATISPFQNSSKDVSVNAPPQYDKILDAIKQNFYCKTFCIHLFCSQQEESNFSLLSRAIHTELSRTKLDFVIITAFPCDLHDSTKRLAIVDK